MISEKSFRIEACELQIYLRFLKCRNIFFHVYMR